jgi:hypothetical protein
MFDADHRRAIDRLAKLLGSGDAHVTVDPKAIVKAAHLGQVETLMLAQDEELWGRFDKAAGTVKVAGESAAGGRNLPGNLLDGVAAQVLHHGGTITILSLDEMLDAAPAAAVLRYLTGPGDARH